MAIMAVNTPARQVLLSQNESGGWTVEVPSLPGCIAQGDTVEEALENVKEAMIAWVESALMWGEQIPESRTLQLATVALDIEAIDEALWDKQFANTPDEVFARMAAKVRQDIAAGRVEDWNSDEIEKNEGLS
jgi:predicted RNase H-like HicB family nuclease